MIYQNDEDEFKKTAEIMIHIVVFVVILSIFSLFGLGFYLIFG